MRFVLILSISFMLLLPLSIFADENNVLKKDNLEIHYSAFNSSFIPPEIAGIYKITRGKKEGLLNIAVLEVQKDGSKKALHATVTGQQYDLIQTFPLEFQEIIEQHAIYYLASFEFQHKTENYFTLFIQPAGASTTIHEPIKLQFNKLLYKDE